MMIRPANFVDIPSLQALAAEMHAASIYAERCTPNINQFGAMCRQWIMGHNGKRPVSCVYVAEQDGKIVGFIVGMLDVLYHFTDKFYATDVFTYVKPDAARRSGVDLIKAFIDWAKPIPEVIEICCGVSDAIGADDLDRKVKLYERLGFTRSGALMTMEVMGNE